MKSVTCLAIIAGEFFVGITMLAAYQAWIQPGAPRFQAQAKVVETPSPSAVVVGQAPPVPSPVSGLPAVAQPEPKVPASRPAPTPQESTAPANDPATILQRGMAALNSQDFPAAVTLLRQARQMQPASADLGYLMGMALEGTGEFGAAIDAFRSCKYGPYRQIAHSHVKALVNKLGKQ